MLKLKLSLVAMFAMSMATLTIAASALPIWLQAGLGKGAKHRAQTIEISRRPNPAHGRGTDRLPLRLPQPGV